MKIIAHRGASAERPENTLSAFERALEIGVDAIETDLLVTKDNHLVTRHDDLIQKDGVWRYVRDLTLPELQSIDVGEGEKIPSLESVFECVRGRCPLVLELKSAGGAKWLANFLKRRAWNQEIHVTSFLLSELVSFAEMFPAIERSLTIPSLPAGADALLREAQTGHVSLHRSFLTEEEVRRLRREGIHVRVYTVNLPEEAQRFASWGVDAIFTDDPAVMQSLR